jgi:hypothetical protein
VTGAQIAALLEGWQSGPGRWTANCPVCELPRGFSVWTSRDGTLLHLRCFGGCHEIELLKQIGITPADLSLKGTNPQQVREGR